MGAPQLVLLCLWMISLGIGISEHGKPKRGEHNVFTEILAIAILAAMLWWGGFWS